MALLLKSSAIVRENGIGRRWRLADRVLARVLSPCLILRNPLIIRWVEARGVEPLSSMGMFVEVTEVDFQCFMTSITLKTSAFVGTYVGT